jgi:sugar/nucleoside kinase (ribokinase family)
VDLLTAGEAFEDLIFVDLPRLPGPGEEVKTSNFVRTFGGGAVITAVAAARLGLRCGVVSGLGREAAAFLKSEGISVKNLKRPDEPHAISAALSTGNQRSFATFNGINDLLEERLLKAVRSASARHVHLALYPRDCSRWLAVLAGFRRRGISTSWDFGWNEGLLQDRSFRDLIQGLDYLFFNEQEAMLYSGKPVLSAAREHWRKHPRNVIIKLGAQGCEWVSPERCLRAAARRVRVVDTTGAGDAFNGGFLYALLRKMPRENCMRIGNRVGGLSTRAAGGINSLPRRDEIA